MNKKQLIKEYLDYKRRWHRYLVWRDDYKVNSKEWELEDREANREWQKAEACQELLVKYFKMSVDDILDIEFKGKGL